MKVDLGDYVLDSNKGDLCLTLYRKDTIQAGRFTNEENIGKEKLVDIGYFSSIEYALKAVEKYTVIDNDDLLVIIDKLDKIEGIIKQIARQLSLERSYGNES